MNFKIPPRVTSFGIDSSWTAQILQIGEINVMAFSRKRFKLKAASSVEHVLYGCP
jgi:hypothetical protein